MSYCPNFAQKCPTLSEMFDSYLEYLSERGAPSYEHVAKLLDHAAYHLGGDTLVSDIGASEVCSWLGMIYER